MSSNYHSSFLAIVGATSFSELMTHPFEVLKVNAQIKFNHSGVNPSRFYLLKKYIERDGIKALYKGFSPGILRAIQNQTIRLYLYGALNKILPQSTIQDQYTLWRQLPAKFFSAFVSSFVAGLTGNPWVVLKVRMIADKKGEYRSLRQSFMNVIHTDGPREFTKGTSITIARGILLSTIELTTYDTLKYVFKSDYIGQHWSYFFASVISSFIAAFCSYPLDVIITLHIHDRSGGQAENRGISQIVNLCREIFSKSGVRGFYAGFSGFASRSMVYGPVFWNSLEFLNELSLEKRFRSGKF